MGPKEWLSASIIVIVALLLVYWVLRTGFDLARASITGVILFVGAYLLWGISAGYFLVPGVDWLYRQFTGQIPQTKMIEDVRGLLGGFPVTSSSAYPAPVVAPKDPDPTPVPERQGSSSWPQAQAPVTLRNELPAPPDISIRQMSLKNVGEVVGYRASRVGDQWVYNQLILLGGSTVPRPGSMPAKFPAPPAPIPAVSTTVIIPTPFPTPIPPTLAPTPTPLSPAEISAKIKSCWLSQVENGLLRGQPPTDPRFVLPKGTTWVLRGPGRGAVITSAENERWLLSSPSLGIQEIPVNGVWGRKFPALMDDNTATFEGQSEICLQP